MLKTRGKARVGQYLSLISGAGGRRTESQGQPGQNKRGGERPEEKISKQNSRKWKADVQNI